MYFNLWLVINIWILLLTINVFTCVTGHYYLACVIDYQWPYLCDCPLPGLGVLTVDCIYHWSTDQCNWLQIALPMRLAISKSCWVAGSENWRLWVTALWTVSWGLSPPPPVSNPPPSRDRLSDRSWYVDSPGS